MMLDESRIASAPIATTRHWPGVETRSLSKKRRKKWRRSSKPVEWVSSSQSRKVCRAWRMRDRSALHGGDNAADQAARVFLLGQLRENSFERGLLHQVAQALNGVVRHDFSFAQYDHGRTDFLDDFEHVRAVED